MLELEPPRQKLKSTLSLDDPGPPPPRVKSTTAGQGQASVCRITPPEQPRGDPYRSLFRAILGGSRLGFSMDSICGQRRK